MAFDSGQGNGHMGMPEVLNHTRIRVQGRTPPLPDGPRLGSLYLLQFVAARQATVIGRDEITTLTLRNGRQEIPPVIGKHAACALLVEPVDISGPTQKYSSQNQAKHSVRVRLGIHQAQRSPPTAAKQYPSVHPEKGPHCFHVVHKILRGVSNKLRQRPRTACSTLIHQNNPVALGIEKAAVIVLAPTTRPTVDDQNRNAIRIAAFFNKKLMRGINCNAMLGVRLDIWEQGEHEALRKEDLTGV